MYGNDGIGSETKYRKSMKEEKAASVWLSAKSDAQHVASGAYQRSGVWQQHTQHGAWRKRRHISVAGGGGQK